MHYYEWNIKSYAADTVHLSNEQDLAYRRLLDYYYDRERPIPTALPPLCHRLRVALPDVEFVLSEFFELQDDGYHHRYCDEKIAEYHDFIERQKRNGSKGGRGNKADAKPKKPTALPKKASAKPTTNHKPLTKKPNNTGRGSRLPTDWVLPKAWGEWALKEAEGIPPEAIRKCSERFRDYWVGVSGSKALKADWEATWRNWVRKEIDYGTLVSQKEKNQSAAPWWTSDASIIAKGKELGLEPRPGESMNEFKGRIQVKIGSDK